MVGVLHVVVLGREGCAVNQPTQEKNRSLQQMASPLHPDLTSTTLEEEPPASETDIPIPPLFSLPPLPSAGDPSSAPSASSYLVAPTGLFIIQRRSSNASGGGLAPARSKRRDWRMMILFVSASKWACVRRAWVSHWKVMTRAWWAGRGVVSLEEWIGRAGAYGGLRAWCGGW